MAKTLTKKQLKAIELAKSMNKPVVRLKQGASLESNDARSIQMRKQNGIKFNNRF